MNGKERMIAALSGVRPDRVPLYIHGINEGPIIKIAGRLTDGLPEVKAFNKMDDNEKLKLVDAAFLIHEEYGVDGFTALDIGNDAFVDEQHVMDDWGVVYQLSDLGLPVAKKHPIPEPADLKGYKPPPPKRERLVLLDLARERFKGEKALFFMMRGTFVKSWRLAGMQNLMLKMFDDPEFVHTLARMTLDYNLELLDMLVDAGLDVLIVEDDIADKNYPLVSPDQFREFINRYNRVIVQKAKEKGLKVIRHSDGNLWPLLDTLLETGYDGLNPLEPQAGMDLKKVREYCGKEFCLLGNIDCIDLLPNGTTEQVEEAVRQAIEDAGQDGGLVICSSNSLHPGVNPDNCIAMFEATKKYGLYDV